MPSEFVAKGLDSCTIILPTPEIEEEFLAFGNRENITGIDCEVAVRRPPRFDKCSPIFCGYIRVGLKRFSILQESFNANRAEETSHHAGPTLETSKWLAFPL